MRTFAIGDIHGCLISLKTIVDRTGFEENDTIIVLGDFVDRGSNTKGVIDCLIELGKAYNLIALRGNHEIMMLEARKERSQLPMWLSVGGEETLESYQASTFEDISDLHWDFIESTVPYFENEKFFFVHASVLPDVPLEEQPEATLYWKPFVSIKPHISGKMMVCGHTSQKSGYPIGTKFGVCIDTYAHGDGWLTCMEVNSGKILQTNERGDFRFDNIERYKD